MTYHQRKARGQCVDCRAKVKPGHVYCANCLESLAAARREKRKDPSTYDVGEQVVLLGWVDFNGNPPDLRLLPEPGVVGTVVAKSNKVAHYLVDFPEHGRLQVLPEELCKAGKQGG